MNALRATALAWRAAGRAAVLVEVTEAAGSVPRGAGTRMLVAADRICGTIGGGHLEWKAMQAAHDLLAMPTSDLVHHLHYALGPSLGQCCGGSVTLRLQRLGDAHLAAWPVPAPRFHLQLYGAGHVGRAIVRLLATLDAQVDWIDERDDAFDQFAADEAAPGLLHTTWSDAAETEVRRAPAGACYLVLTHRHDLDQRITEAVLRRGDFAFLGLIGSATKRQRFLRRYSALGIAPALLDRMTCPIGVAGIVGKEPEVIAVAAVAQLLQVTAPR